MLNGSTMERMAVNTLPPAADDLGGRIRQARTFKGLKQDQLGERVAVSRETISAWENGRTAPSVPELIRIASETGFPARFFVDGLSPSAGRTAGCLYVDNQELPLFGAVA